MRLRVLGVLLALAVTTPASAQAPIRAEGLVALVGGSAPGPGVIAILRSDVDLRARLHLAGQLRTRLPLGPLPPDLVRATLDELVGEALIAREAERVQIATPSSRDVSRERRRLEQMAGGRERLAELLDELGVDPEEIDASARRRALVSTFLEANLEGASVVTEADVQRYYDSGEHPFGDPPPPLDEVRETLRSLLSRRALDEAVRRWVTVLRARTVVRVTR